MAARAWCAPQVEELDGWLLRYAWGTTRRANSVLAAEHGETVSLDQKIARVEARYAVWNQPARFQISPASHPPELDEVLAARGYRSEASRLVQVAPIDAIGAGRGRATLTDEADSEWIRTMWLLDRGRAPEPSAEEIIRATKVPAIHASVREGDEIIAVGRGVAEHGWLGIFGMGTQLSHRRGGLATEVLGALASWGRGDGATRAYLQVEEGNAAARNLYARAGFVDAYRYHYRSAPQ